jgi:hypothetical protein
MVTVNMALIFRLTEHKSYGSKTVILFVRLFVPPVRAPLGCSPVDALDVCSVDGVHSRGTPSS